MSFPTLLLIYPVVNHVIDKSIEYRCNRWLSALEPFNPPSENTGNKSELVGVAVSVGEALSTPLFHCDNCLDLPEIMRCNDVCRGA